MRAALAVQQQSAIIDIEAKLQGAGSPAPGREQVPHQGIGEGLVALLGTGAVDDPIDREGARFSSGLGNGAAQYAWTRAIHLAPASAVVPFQYLQLVWAMLLGFAVWGDLPTLGLLAGSAIVIASGLFLFWRETRKVPVAED